MINLLSNAVKYTPEGGNIWFRIIGLKQRSEQYEHIRIEVEDDGYGMTQEYLKTIFDAFTRAENSTTNKVQGTGLGMAITKNIVELMGGTIDVSSEVDKGSLFTVELECRIPEKQTDMQFWEKNGISRIMLVDSDEQSNKDIQTLMENEGVAVDTFLYAKEAIRTIEEENDKKEYQMILLDWDTAEMNAIEVAEKIRKVLQDTVPVIFLTVSDINEIEEVCRVENTGVFVKPFFVSIFKEKVLEVQKGQREEEVLEKVESGNLEGMRFLAAEDNEINAEILLEILSIEGASCEITGNGQLALERFKDSEEGEFDAILMDVQMPVMNGYDATKAIRALERKDAKEIPIIAMTANAFAEDEKEALDAGMNVHLAKPIDMELLKKVLTQYTIRRE